MIKAIWYDIDEAMPLTDIGYDAIITINTVGTIFQWSIADFYDNWHAGDATARHTHLWTYVPTE